MNTDIHNPAADGYSGSWADWIGESIGGSERSARRRRAAEFYAGRYDEVDGYGRTPDEYDGSEDDWAEYSGAGDEYDSEVPLDVDEVGPDFEDLDTGSEEDLDYDEADAESSARALAYAAMEAGGRGEEFGSGVDEASTDFAGSAAREARPGAGDGEADVGGDEPGYAEGVSDARGVKPEAAEGVSNARGEKPGDAADVSDIRGEKPGDAANVSDIRGEKPGDAADVSHTRGEGDAAHVSGTREEKPQGAGGESDARQVKPEVAEDEFDVRRAKSGADEGESVADDVQAGFRGSGGGTGVGGKRGASGGSGSPVGGQRGGQVAGARRGRKVRPHPFPSSDPHWIPDAPAASAIPHPYSSAAARAQAPVDPRARAAASRPGGAGSGEPRETGYRTHAFGDSEPYVEYATRSSTRSRAEFEPGEARPAASAAARLHRAPASHRRRGGSSWEGWAIREWLAESRERWAVPLLGILGICAIGAAVTVQLTKSDATPPPAAAAEAPPQLQPATEPAAPAAATGGDCPAETNGSHVRGNGPGGYATGPEAILALQHAYYVARSGALVRSLVDLDASIPSAPEIQAGIDTVPEGTTHCVQISPGAFSGQYTVIITEFRPDKTTRIWSPQLVMTTARGERTVITAIVPLADDVAPR
ncbi:hypothetical protein [Nocardia sp. NPDC050406]|uniref:hypothetical protein n=1 Tax=Nocardia sp. NPDC050406 TaxID=3364318 RepID=UPI003794DEEA